MILLEGLKSLNLAQEKVYGVRREAIRPEPEEQ